jgi:Na+/proline symporter
MSLDNPTNIKQVQTYYYIGFSSIFFLAIIAGLAARVFLPNNLGFDPELALPTLAQHLLPDVLIGLFLAGLFAASISTADSQILSCSAAIANDLSIPMKNKYLLTKIATVATTFLALFFAIFGSKNVFSIVLISWSALASAFTSIVVLKSFDIKISQVMSISMLAFGLGGMSIWMLLGLNKYVYEAMAGILVSFIPYIAHCLYLHFRPSSRNIS